MQLHTETRSVGSRDRRRGSQVVEAALMILPLLALVFLTIDSAWALFVKATLQQAVNDGARYAVTLPQSSGTIQSWITSQYSLLANPNNIVSVTYTPVTGATLIQVTSNYTYSPLAPLFRSGATINLSATAVEMMEPASP